MNAPVKIKAVPIDEATVVEAEALGIDVAAACETDLRARIKRAADDAWMEENRAAMDAWNDWIDEHGLPLARYRVI